MDENRLHSLAQIGPSTTSTSASLRRYSSKEEQILVKEYSAHTSESANMLALNQCLIRYWIMFTAVCAIFSRIKFVFPIALACGCLMAFVSGCSSAEKELDETHDWSAQELYDEAKEAMDGGDYTKAVNYYEKLESRYPLGPYASQAQLEAAYTFYRNDKPDSAIASIERFLRLHPTHPNADYAYYLKGVVNFNHDRGYISRILKNNDSKRDVATKLASFDDFAELVRRFPKSRYAEDARKRMLYLRNTLAMYELNVANYYMRRYAYIAAANRAKYIVKNYPSSTSVPAALTIMVKAYNALSMNKLAMDALEVLEHSYPNYETISTLSTTLEFPLSGL